MLEAPIRKIFMIHADSELTLPIFLEIIGADIVSHNGSKALTESPLYSYLRNIYFDGTITDKLACFANIVDR